MTMSTPKATYEEWQKARSQGDMINPDSYEADVAALADWMRHLDDEALAVRLKYGWAGVRTLLDRVHGHLHDGDRK